MEERIINIGDHFEKWEVIGAAVYSEGDHPRKMHPCRCKCGTERNVLAKALLAGKSTSCGCDRKEKIAAAKKLKRESPVVVGQKFGRLTVMEIIEGSTPLRVVCRCSCDGKLVEIEERKLREELITSCGCTSGGRRDLSGKQFGHLLVLNDFRSAGDEHIEWRTRCDLCGREKWIRGSRMVSGKANSCGCQNGPNFTKNQKVKEESDGNQ